MKFSVVIPCHNRLSLLKEAVYTVLQQNHPELELIIFDNASDKELADFVKELADSRIHYDRSDQFLPVTDSWNRAIEMATGDYVIFLGDDDGLIPHFFSRLTPIIEKFDNPEILYSAFYQFMHPGVAHWAPEGYIAEHKNGFFFADQNDPFLLSPTQAYKAVKGSLTLRRNFAFNIQAFVFSNKFLTRLKEEGPIFHSPFPDYYIANIALAKSKSTVIIPEPLVITGVSKASVGCALFNGLEERFEAILNTKLSSDSIYKEIQNSILPGSLYKTNYILTMEHLIRQVRSFIQIKINYKHYRLSQIYSLFCNNLKQGKTLLDIPCWNHLSIFEKIWAFFLSFLLKLKQKNKLCSRIFTSRLDQMMDFESFRAMSRICNEGNYHSLIDVFHAMQKGSLI